jgi:hypothetical protein
VSDTFYKCDFYNLLPVGGCGQDARSINRASLTKIYSYNTMEVAGWEQLIFLLVLFFRLFLFVSLKCQTLKVRGQVSEWEHYRSKI